MSDLEILQILQNIENNLLIFHATHGMSEAQINIFISFVQQVKGVDN